MTPNPHSILVIDDDPLFRRLMLRVLGRVGFTIQEAPTGRVGLDKVREALSADRPFAAAFVDLDMPGWDGIETIKQIWKVDREIQIVIATGSPRYDFTELHHEIDRSRTLLVIKKPVEAIEIAQAAFSSCSAWDIQRQARRHAEHLEAMVLERTIALEAANRQLAKELAWRDLIETDLCVRQRLEAVGQLSSGIAHEINTPMQYVGDNLQFLHDGMHDLIRVVDGASALIAQQPDGNLSCELARLYSAADIGYIRNELPCAFESIQHGVTRISEIVRAMKELSHTGPRESAPADLNRAIANALEVTANSYRYVAEVDKQLEVLPPVHCHVAEVGQVLVNLIVNAAHAMEDLPRGRGTLGIRSRVDGDHVVISISDTGNGIPLAIQDRIFDAFFTTKKVGRGTGQGLAISRSIVVDRHHGSLTFESLQARGTRFDIRLPIGPATMYEAAG